MSGAIFVKPIDLSDGSAIDSINVTNADDPAAYSSGTTYAAGDQVRVEASQKIYQSLQNGNTGNAVTATAWWVEVGATNKMRMFDRKIGALTENADTIEVVITPGELVTVVSILNITAMSATLEQTTPGEGLVYSKTIDLQFDVDEWYDYYYDPVAFANQAVFTGLVPATDATYTLTIDNTGGTAKCGELVMGAGLVAGTVESGLQDGIDDYSVIEADQFGVRTIVERDFADNMDLTLYVDTTRSPVLRRFLADNRAAPFLVVPTDARPDAQVYGFAETWKRILSYPGLDVFNITMRGLT